MRTEEANTPAVKCRRINKRGGKGSPETAARTRPAGKCPFRHFRGHDRKAFGDTQREERMHGGN